MDLFSQSRALRYANPATFTVLVRLTVLEHGKMTSVVHEIIDIFRLSACECGQCWAFQQAQTRPCGEVSELLAPTGAGPSDFTRERRAWPAVSRYGMLPNLAQGQCDGAHLGSDRVSLGPRGPKEDGSRILAPCMSKARPAVR